MHSPRSTGSQLNPQASCITDALITLDKSRYCTVGFAHKHTTYAVLYETIVFLLYRITKMQYFYTPLRMYKCISNNMLRLHYTV